MMSNPVVHIANLTVQYPNQSVLQSLNWQIEQGENWLIGGKSGSGKTTLALAIADQVQFSGNVDIHFDSTSPLPAKTLYVSNWYQFTNLEGDRNFYYQQRYNKHQGNDTLTVYAEFMHYGKQENLNPENLEVYLRKFGFQNQKHTQLIELSSGEHKKLQLIKALWLQPQILIIDQPYTGLDKQSRHELNNVFNQLASKGVTLILISNDEEHPDCIHRFAEIQEGQLEIRSSASEISREAERISKPLPGFLQQPPKVTSDIMVSMRNVTIRYDEKEVLKNIDWEVRTGEKWLLQGHNGSGKSTLLSLINGDHPQAYANDITLFGKKRGSGESIWEIKEHLGIISPEMHWYFDATAKVWQSIASGFFDSVGLFRDLSFEKQRKVDEILAFFDLKEYKNQLLSTLPLGKQRLVLLARTIIKNPELLILDEPCQGLDYEQTKQFNAIVDELCSHGNTLIYVGHFETQLPSCIDNRIILENGKVKAVETALENA
ncbi:ABC transporter, ATP-binding protein [Sphingobacterium spiritivorum ATCC 33300]|uniref:ABC transporter, ATP-binding protein n=1 Tax=Sphingobacterium spiritivorum ATCC 33300 TaxID=525372 RepID=C2FX04_SPHSI|nr:ATP-binding cassette domain-containing protein [Sphingobacterium spiritivorum]EEI92517.1 ABC transporter, ATP-binding protein [Sphingobacterium spiritivorum ATCC 33300]QQS94049.1 ATP-binding cassette domain-containing protein [Sphingobacterium spiritivorum]